MRWLAGFTVACVLAVSGPIPAIAQPAGGGDGAPAAKAGDQAVLDDIETTLRGLSDHISLGSKRVRVGGAAGRVGNPLPNRIDIAVGNSMNVDLPAEAQEVVVGDATIIDVVTVNSKRRIFIMARKIGRSNVFVLDGSANVISRVEVQVGVDGESVDFAMKKAFPDEAIVISTEGASVVLQGHVTSDAIAGRAVAIARRFVEKNEMVVNLLRVSREQQVLLQVRVAEVQKNILKEIGADTYINQPRGLIGSPRIKGQATSRGLLESTSPAAEFFISGINDLLFRLQFLESRGLVRNLAEPNLVAVSGESASMLAGGEVPIPVADKDGIKLEMKPFGVSLGFLPIVLDSGRISLKLSTEVSALSSNEAFKWPLVGGGTIDIPGFTVRRASSTVELPNGGSLMIAGLIQSDILSGINGVPGVMDVPILGQLFKSDSFRRRETELVIFVSAHLVKPTAPTAMRVPTDALSPGGDIDMWLFGKMLGRYTPGFQQDRVIDRPQASYGFTIDEVLP